MRFFPRPTRLLIGSAIVVSLNACSSSPVEQSVAELMDCEDLKLAVSSASQDFDNIKRGTITTRYGQKWNTSVQAFQNGCSIVALDGPAYYTCSGQVNQTDTEWQLETASNEIAACLGDGWQTTAESSGDIAITQLHAESPSVTLKSFTNDQGGQMIVMRIDQ